MITTLIFALALYFTYCTIKGLLFEVIARQHYTSLKHPGVRVVYLICTILFWSALFHVMRLETDEVVEDFDYVLSEKNKTVYEYDYIIDLKQDHIHIDTDDGRCLTIHPDSLQEFIYADNL